MVVIFIIAIILVVAAIVIVQTFINKGVYRAKQTAFKGVGLDYQTINDKIVSGPLHTKGLAQFQADYYSVSAQMLESKFSYVVNAVLSGTAGAGIDSGMIQKIRNSGKFKHLQNGTYIKTGIINYRQKSVYAQAVFAEGTDQWILYIRGTFDASASLTVTQLQISRGIQGGF
ncbi:MAG: hypothetical protein ACI4EF_07605 [Coprococcus sp.]